MTDSDSENSYVTDKTDTSHKEPLWLHVHDKRRDDKILMEKIENDAYEKVKKLYKRCKIIGHGEYKRVSKDFEDPKRVCDMCNILIPNFYGEIENDRFLLAPYGSCMDELIFEKNKEIPFPYKFLCPICIDICIGEGKLIFYCKFVSYRNFSIMDPFEEITDDENDKEDHEEN